MELVPLSILPPPLEVEKTIAEKKKKKGAKKQKVVPQQNTSPTMNTRSKVSTSPSSPATGTRSKRKLNVS